MPGSGSNVDFGFRRGTSTALYHTSIKNGTFNLCTDTGDLYVDIDNRRIAVKDIICMDREADILALENPYTRIYYAGDTYNLWRYDTNLHAWKQVSGELVRKAIKAERDNNNNIITEYYQTKSAASSDYSNLSGRIGAIESTISQLGGFNIVLVEDFEHLPATGASGTLYFVPNNSGSQTDLYDEYIWLPTENYYEKIGVSTADLSNYYTKTQIDSKLSSYSASSQTYTKSEVDTALSNKAASTHSHDVFSYATTVSNGTKGFVPAPNSGQYDYVLTAHGWAANAASATYATNAGTAVRATNAASATNATNDGNGSNIAQTYVNNATTGDHSIVFSKGDGSTFSVEVAGGGTDLSDDIISLDSNNEYEQVSFYMSGIPEESIDTIDNLPIIDSYANKFIYELTVIDSEITSSTTPIDMSSYYDEDYGYLSVFHYMQVFDPIDQSLPPYNYESSLYHTPRVINLHNYKCRFLRDDSPSYLYYYYAIYNTGIFEVWSKEVPLALDGLGNSPSSMGKIVAYDYNNESVSVVDFTDETNTDIVLYVNGSRLTENTFPQYSGEASNSITNIIKYDSTNSNSETAIIAHLKLVDDLVYYKKTYGIFVDFIHGYMGEKYLVFPVWNNVFEQSIKGNKFIKGAITPLVEGEFAVFEYNTNFLMYSNIADLYYNGSFYCFDPLSINNKKLLIKKNPLGTKYPASYIYRDTLFPANEGFVDTESAKESIYVEFSKNGLCYNKDLKDSFDGSNEPITSQDIINALEYTPANSELLGEKVRVNVQYDSANSSSDTKITPNIDIKFEQYATNLFGKVFPNIENYQNGRVHSIYRTTGYIGGSIGTLLRFSDEDGGRNLLITCPYNNKKYKFYYRADSNYFNVSIVEIYSNKVIVAHKESDYLQYLNPGTTSSADQLVELVVPTDDTDFYAVSQYNTTNQRITDTNISRNLSGKSEGYYERNYELFDTAAEALSYATFYYDHMVMYQDVNERVSESVLFAGYFDIANKQLYLMDFMQSYNGREFNTGTVHREEIYWYQVNKSNDPNHPLYDANATPTVGSPIFYTRAFWKPYEVASMNCNPKLVPETREAIGIENIYGLDEQPAQYYIMTNLSYDCYSGSYAPGEIITQVIDNDTSNKQTYISNASTATGSIVFTKGDGSTFSISVPSGGPDAEILDARIGVNGTTYADLGTAIRSQISDLANGIIAALNANY